MATTFLYLAMLNKRTQEKIDIVKLNAEIKEIVAREETLRKAIDEIIAEIEV